MEASDLKLALFRKIDTLSDKRLAELYQFFKDQDESAADFWDDLSKAQKKDIEQGIEDLEAERSTDFTKILSKYK